MLLHANNAMLAYFAVLVAFVTSTASANAAAAAESMGEGKAGQPSIPSFEMSNGTSRTSNVNGYENTVKKVHLVFSHHLDVGLDLLPFKTTKRCVGYATQIVQRYFDEYIPRAVSLGARARARARAHARGVQQQQQQQQQQPQPPRPPQPQQQQLSRFVYQVHAWIALMYVDCIPWHDAPFPPDLCPATTGTLRCPTSKQVASFEAAIKAGDIVWAHSPFDVNAGAVGEPSFLEAMVTDIAQVLDSRYRIPTRHLAAKSVHSAANATPAAAAATAQVWSNIDVKGFARSAIPTLLKSGITALYVGQNGHPSTTPGTVQRIFVNIYIYIFIYTSGGIYVILYIYICLYIYWLDIYKKHLWYSKVRTRLLAGTGSSVAYNRNPQTFQLPKIPS